MCVHDIRAVADVVIRLTLWSLLSTTVLFLRKLGVCAVPGRHQIRFFCGLLSSSLSSQTQILLQNSLIVLTSLFNSLPVIGMRALLIHRKPGVSVRGYTEVTLVEAGTSS